MCVYVILKTGPSGLHCSQTQMRMAGSVWQQPLFSRENTTGPGSSSAAAAGYGLHWALQTPLQLSPQGHLESESAGGNRGVMTQG